MRLGTGLALTQPRTSVPSTYDPDAAAFFAAQVAAGQTLTTTQKSAVNQLVVSAKANSWWSECSLIYPFLGNSAACDSINLANPALHPITWNGVVIHDANGITGSGTTGYGDTGFAFPSTIISNGHYSLYRRAYATAESRDIGAADLTTRNLVSLIHAVSSTVDIVEISPDFSISGEAITYPSSTLGLIAASAQSLTSLSLYYSGALVSNNATNRAGTFSITYPCFVLSQNLGGSPSETGDSNIAFMSVGTALSDAQAAAMATDVQAFQTTLSRQV